MFKTVVTPALFLFVSTMIIAALLGFVHQITKEPIAAQLANEQLSAKQMLLPSAVAFETVDVADKESSSVVMMEKGFNDSEQEIGYVVTVTPAGYGGKILTMIGFDETMSITGYHILDSNETPGLGDVIAKPDFVNRFVGRNQFPIQIVKTVPKETEVQAVTGATISSKAITQGINDAAEAIISLEGGKP